MKGPVRSLEISYFVHATEDPDRLARAVHHLLSMAPPSQVEEMEGHHGNKISSVRMHITGEEAQRAFERIVEALGSEAKDALLRDLGSHLDEHSALFIRFDKQRLVSGSLRLEATDPVRVKIKPRPFLLGRDAPRFYSVLLSGR